MSEARQPAETKPAATILLLRDAPEFQVLMVKRHHQIDFASGALVFPGGKTHAGDTDPAWAQHCVGWDQFDDEQRTLADGDAAKLREIFERLYVVRAVCDYHAPARFDDELEVCVRTVQIGRSSMRVGFEIHRAGEKLVSGENVYVHAQDGASAPVPDFLRETIVRYERTAPLQ